MALFVFGAGATRGCSFVDPRKDPCLPPLDGDFFTQLQRVRNAKHHALIDSVMEDVVELFGSNFEATMETVFTTLEHTIRMLDTTGQNRDFKIKDLKEKRDRLEQAIAVVLEDSLAAKDDQGHSSLKPRCCKHHERLVKELLKTGDDIITFNYDCVLDYALKQGGDRKWDARYGYGFSLGARGKSLTGDAAWQPAQPAGKDQTVHLYKLHGSLHFNVKGSAGAEKVHLKERPYTKQHGTMHFTIIPPEWHKAYDKGVFSKLWHDAAGAINRARHMVLIGYSLPPTDLHSTALFRTSIKSGALKSLVVVNPDRAARRRTRSVLQRGLAPTSKILSFDYLDHFVAAHRDVWAT